MCNMMEWQRDKLQSRDNSFYIIIFSNMLNIYFLITRANSYSCCYHPYRFRIQMPHTTFSERTGKHRASDSVLIRRLSKRSTSIHSAKQDVEDGSLWCFRQWINTCLLPSGDIFSQERLNDVPEILCGKRGGDLT